MSKELKRNVNYHSDFQKLAFGRSGFRVIDSSFTPVADEYYTAFAVIEDAVITTTGNQGDNLSSEAISEGSTIYGLFSSISVASGKVIAYIC